MLTNKINSVLLHPINKLFYRNQMHYNYKSDEKIMKTLIHKNILPTDPNEKIKLIIYYNKFKTSNLVIRNNSSPNLIYKFKCPLGDCISDNNNIYVGLTSTTLSRRLTMHLSDTSSIAQHLKKHSCPVGWGCRIHRLLLCRGVRPPPPTSVLDMTLNNLMVRFQQCWSFGECRVPLHCHHSQVHSGLEW